MAFALAGVLTVALAQESVLAGFVGVTGSSANKVTAAASFCTTPGNETKTATADSFVQQGSPSSVSGGSATYLVVTPQAGAAHRMYLRFDLPNVPARCDVSGATLEVYAESQVAGRTLGAYRVAPTPVWTEATLNWTNKPLGVSPAQTVVMPNTDQYVSWTVTSLVQDMYALGNNGFVVQDQDETGPGAWQQFRSRSMASPPLLKVFWS